MTSIGSSRSLAESRSSVLCLVSCQAQTWSFANNSPFLSGKVWSFIVMMKFNPGDLEDTAGRGGRQPLLKQLALDHG